MRLLRIGVAVVLAFVIPMLFIGGEFGFNNEEAVILYVLWLLAGVIVVVYLAKLKMLVPVQAIRVPLPVLFLVIGYLLGSLCRRKLEGLQLGVLVGCGTMVLLVALVRGRVKVQPTFGPYPNG